MIKTRRIRWEGHVAHVGRGGTHRILVGKSDRKRPLGRPRHMWVGSNKTGWDSMDWIDVAQDMDQCRTLVNMVMNLQVT
jgi:hypothetical protein